MDSKSKKKKSWWKFYLKIQDWDSNRTIILMWDHGYDYQKLIQQ